MNETELERLVIRLIGDPSSYIQMMATASKAVDQTTQEIQKHAASLGNFQNGVSGVMGVLRQYGTVVGSLVGITGVLGTTQFGLKLASEAEQAEVAFSSLLHSEDQAKLLLNDLYKLAAETPFEFPQVRQGARSLLSAKFAAADIVPVLKNLGDITSAMGTGAEGINRATYALMQMRQANKITGQDMMQLVNAGIPAWKILAASMGKTTDQVMKMAHSGHGFGEKELNGFFEALKSGKGTEDLAGGMEKQSKTLQGLFSTLKDYVGQAMTQITRSIVDAIDLKGMLSRSIASIGAWSKWIIATVQSMITTLKPIVMFFWNLFTADSGVTAGIFMLIVSFETLAAILTPIIGFAASFFSPFIIGAVILAGTISFLIARMGGLGTIWKWIQTTAIAAWQFIRPYAIQTMNIIEAATFAFMRTAMMVWKMVANAASTAWNYVSGIVMSVLNSISGATATTFGDIQYWFMSALVAAEFCFYHIEEIAAYAWLKAQLDFTTFINVLVYYLDTVLPAYVSYFVNNFTEIWTTMFINIGTVTQNALSNIKEMFIGLWEYIKSGGTVAFEPNFTPLLQGTEAAFKNLPEIAERQATEAEEILKEKFGAAGASLQKDFDTFHKLRMAELFPQTTPGVMSEAETKDLGKLSDTAGDIGNKIGTEIKKAAAFDSALVGSKEAASHISEYQAGVQQSNSPAVQAVTATKKNTETMEKMTDAMIKFTEYMQDVGGQAGEGGVTLVQAGLTA